MESFWFVALIPMAVAWGARFFFTAGKLSLLEVTISIGIAVAISFGMYEAGRWSKTADTEVWNGQVTSKERKRVSCEHSYSCNCRQSCSGSGSNQSCSQVCDTCYEHSYDVSWYVYTTAGEDYTIRRVNRQGTEEPPRWSAVYTGEPASSTHSYTNWVKAVPESLFSDESASALATYKDKVPPYPLDVYDYWHVDRVIDAGAKVSDLAMWNRDLQEMLKTRGPTKQANAVIVITGETSPAFAQALKAAWLGGKKNDSVTVIGVDGRDIRWVRVFSWSKESMFDVALRDSLLDLKVLDRGKVILALGDAIDRHWKRRSMKEYEYLASQVQPPAWAVVLAAMLALGISGFLSWKLSEVDLDEAVMEALSSMLRRD